MGDVLKVVFVGATTVDLDPSRFETTSIARWDEATRGPGGAGDVVVVDGDRAAPPPAEFEAAAARRALVVVAVDPDAEHALAWLRRGAADVLTREELAGPAGGRRLRFAHERGQAARVGAKAYATDLGTGLPHRQQLVEHLSQLLALREREPAPMAVVALRVEGLPPGGGGEIESLRRKIGVRLRAGVRASDVVASLGGDGFAVLLGSMLAPEDAERVAAKLVESLLLPFGLAGGERRVGVAAGIARHPQDGSEAERLLRRAVALAAAAPAAGSSHDGRDEGRRIAANDDR